MRASGQSVLDTEQAAFVQGGVSILVAGRDPANLPRLARAFGCRVSEDRRTAAVLLARYQSAGLLAAIRANRAIAVVYTLPSTHRSLQLKGDDATIGPIVAGDVDRARACADAFVADIVPLGYDEALCRALLWLDPSELVAVSFTPSVAFDQTPGPRAGERIGA